MIVIDSVQQLDGAAVRHTAKRSLQLGRIRDEDDTGRFLDIDAVDTVRIFKIACLVGRFGILSGCFRGGAHPDIGRARRQFAADEHSAAQNLIAGGNNAGVLGGDTAGHDNGGAVGVDTCAVCSRSGHAAVHEDGSAAACTDPFPVDCPRVLRSRPGDRDVAGHGHRTGIARTGGGNSNLTGGDITGDGRLAAVFAVDAGAAGSVGGGGDVAGHLDGAACAGGDYARAVVSGTGHVALHGDFTAAGRPKRIAASTFGQHPIFCRDGAAIRRLYGVGTASGGFGIAHGELGARAVRMYSGAVADGRKLAHTGVAHHTAACDTQRGGAVDGTGVDGQVKAV